MRCSHDKVALESPMSFQWTPEGIRAVGRCEQCGARGTVFKPGFIVDATTRRWNTDNERDLDVSVLVGK